MSKKELSIPQPKLISVGEHPYSLQAVGEKLPIWNAAKYAEAFERVSASEKSVPIRPQERLIQEASRIARYGRGLLAVGVFDNLTPNPGHPDTLRGYMYVGIERVKEYGIAVNRSRVPTLNQEVPSIFNGPVVAKEYKSDSEKEDINRLNTRDRFMLKLYLTRFAINAFASEQLAQSYGLSTSAIRVNADGQDFEGREALEAAGISRQLFLSASKSESGEWVETVAHELPPIIWLNDRLGELVQFQL